MTTAVTWAGRRLSIAGRVVNVAAVLICTARTVEDHYPPAVFEAAAQAARDSGARDGS